MINNTCGFLYIFLYFANNPSSDLKFVFLFFAGILIAMMSSNVTLDDVRNTFLSIGIISACVLNIYLIFILGLSEGLRRRSVYKLVINSATTNLLDVVNLCMVLHWSLKGSNTAPKWVCLFNNFLINWVDDIQMLNIFFIAIERFCAVHAHQFHRNRFRIGGCFIIVSVTWLLTLLVNIFIAVDSIKSQYSKTRFSCVISTNETDANKKLVYPILTSCAFYLIPLLVIVIIYIRILLDTLKTHNVDVERSNRIARELRMSKMTASVFLGWLILVGPYSIKVFIDIVNMNEDDIATTTNGNIELALDTSFFWMRHFYINCLPLLCVFWRRDVRRKTRELVCVKRHPNALPNKTPQTPLNSIGTPCQQSSRCNGDPLRRNPETGEEDDLSISSEDNYDQLPPGAMRPQPIVLFATSEGLHLQTDPMCDSHGSENITTARVIKCDVNSSVADLQSNDFDYEQDDYDEAENASNRGSDTFQRSNPISVRSIEPLEKEEKEEKESDSKEVRRKKRSRGIDSSDQPEVSPKPSESKTRRKKHKRSSSSSDVAPAPLYSAQVSLCEYFRNYLPLRLTQTR